jgi:hypothetical protein
MRKFIVFFILFLLICGVANAQTWYSWRYRTHATDCTALTDGKVTDLCFEVDSATFYKCVPDAGDCSGTEWKAVEDVVDTNTTYSSSDFNHDDLTGFVSNEHIDWTSDQGATNIHAGNYTDTNTTYSASGTLLDLSSTTFSVKAGTLTDTKGCKFTTASGLVCDQDYLTSVASDSTWTGHNSYPSACSAGQYVSAVGDTLTCGTPTDTNTNASTICAGTTTYLDGEGNCDDISGVYAPLVSPSFTTPTLGVAAATSINKVAITAPATSATLTIANGKTLTATNTVNLNTMTDGKWCKYTATGTLLDCNVDPVVDTNTTYTAGDGLTLTGTDIDFDGGASPAGELGGTWASPTIDDSLAVTSWTLTTPTITSGVTFTDANISPDVAGELVYDNTVTGLLDGAFAWYDGDAVRYLVDLATLPADDDYVVAYDADNDGFYMKVDATGAGGVADGDKGDITVSSDGAVWAIDADTVADSEINWDSVIGINSANVNWANIETLAPINSAGVNWADMTDLASGGAVTWANLAEGELATGVVVSDDIKDGTIAGADLATNIAITSTGVQDYGGATSFEIPNGTSPTVDAAGEIAVDTTDDQLVYYGGAKRVIPYERTACAVIENLAATDDNYAIWMANDAVTITGVGCNCRGTCSTTATFTLEDRGGNAMTITDTNPTCATTGAATFKAVTAGNQLTAGEMLAFDVTNTPTADDEYALCFTYTVDAQ